MQIQTLIVRRCSLFLSFEKMESCSSISETVIGNMGFERNGVIKCVHDQFISFDLSAILDSSEGIMAYILTAKQRSKEEQR